MSTATLSPKTRKNPSKKIQKGGNGSSGTKAVAKKKAPPAPEKRNYSLDAATVRALKASRSHNPYRIGSSYYYCVEVGWKLGVGKFHPIEKLIAAYAKMADADKLKEFKRKEPRCDEGADWKDRICTNFYVVCRADYGRKLRQCGFEMRYELKDGVKRFGVFKLSK